MILPTEIRRRLRSLVWPLIAAALAVYFGYHGIYGNRGLLALAEVDAKVEAAAIERNALASDRAAREHRVSRLRDATLDPDLLGEQARATVGLGREREVVILAPRE